MRNGPARDTVLAWLESRLGRTLTPAEQADIFAATGLTGQAADDLIADFAKEFGVDLTQYDPLAHREEDGTRPGWPIPHRPKLGLLLPVSVTLLHLSALAGEWRQRMPDLRPSRGLAWANLPLLLIGLPVLTALLLALLF